MAIKHTTYLTRGWRLARLGFHLAHGLWIAATRLSRMSQQRRMEAVQRWSRQLLNLLGLEVEVIGKAPGLHPPNTLLIANHISWLDIFALNSLTVAQYVAKKEIRSWPFIGWLVASVGTLFIDRTSRRDASRINEHLARALENGSCMAVFPEATTSEGDVLLPFKASLFESALLAGATVQPVAIRYVDKEGNYTAAASYAGDTTFMESLYAIVRQPRIRVVLDFATPLSAPLYPSRFALSEAARQEVESRLKLSPAPADTAPKTPADLPA
jgi:1-acyl-sn-glycerol-3-phosphate acyltransferase